MPDDKYTPKARRSKKKAKPPLPDDMKPPQDDEGFINTAHDVSRDGELWMAVDQQSVTAEEQFLMDALENFGFRDPDAARHMLKFIKTVRDFLIRESRSQQLAGVRMSSILQEMAEADTISEILNRVLKVRRRRSVFGQLVNNPSPSPQPLQSNHPAPPAPQTGPLAPGGLVASGGEGRDLKIIGPDGKETIITGSGQVLHHMEDSIPAFDMNATVDIGVEGQKLTRAWLDEMTRSNEFHGPK